MVITFSVPEARNQLMNKGIVYTFRWARRIHFSPLYENKGPKEFTWAAAQRNKPKIADVMIEELERIPIETDFLEPYADESGFPSAQDWLNKIYGMAQYPHQIKSHGYIYRVTRELRMEKV